MKNKLLMLECIVQYNNICIGIPVANTFLVVSLGLPFLLLMFPTGSVCKFQKLTSEFKQFRVPNLYMQNKGSSLCDFIAYFSTCRRTVEMWLFHLPTLSILCTWNENHGLHTTSWIISEPDTAVHGRCIWCYCGVHWPVSMSDKRNCRLL